MSKKKKNKHNKNMKKKESTNVLNEQVKSNVNDLEKVSKEVVESVIDVEKMVEETSNFENEINDTVVEEVSAVEKELKKDEVKEDEKNLEIKNENDKKVSNISKVAKRKGNIKNRKILITLLLVITFIILVFLSFTCYCKMYTKVYTNVYLFGVDMSGKTEEEVINFVNKYLQNNTLKDEESNLSGINKGVDVYQNLENIYKISPSDFDFKIDVAKTVQKVMEYGRKKGIFANDLDVLKATFGKEDITAVFSYNEEKVDEILKNIELTLDGKVIDDSYILDETTSKLVITKGTSGNSIDFKLEKQKLISLLENMYVNDNIVNSLKLDVITKEPAKLDVSKVYDEVVREPQDAYIDKTKTPIELVSEKVGYSFEKNEFQEVLELSENKYEGKTIYFDLTVIEPNVKLDDISYTLYQDKLAGYTTYFVPGVYARSTNLKIALEYLNDKVIMPGETFSYNAALGEINAAKGYQAAAVFKGGTTVNEIGGGICQTTSTLYNVALMANLEIVERYQHGLPVGYVPPSRDATVYEPYLDFKFKNTRNYPVKIVTSFTYDGSLNISLYGTKEENEYEVILSSKTLRTINFSTKYIYDETLPEGEQVVVINGVNGYQSESYITKKLNGQVVSSNLLSRDTYNPQVQVVRIGTKKSE